MVEAYLLDDNFDMLEICDYYLSFIWRSKYYETGDFELHASAAHFPMLNSARYVCKSDTQGIGIIEQSEVADGLCFVKGRFLKSALADTVIFPTQYLSGTGEQVIRTLLAEFTVLELDPEEGVGADMEEQVTGDNLLEHTEAICIEQEITFDVFYDYANSRLYAKVWQGKDLTEEQTENSWVTFSNENESLERYKYSRSDKDFKNYAIVAGAGEGDARICEVVDLSGGGRRRELWVDAKNIQPKNADGSAMTEYAYRLLLRQKGREVLAKYSLVETFDMDPMPQSKFVYGVDYNLGDIVSAYDSTLDLFAKKRVTEVEEVFEGEEAIVSIKCGQGYLVITDYMKRELKP